MWVKRLQLKNLRSFDAAEIDFSPTINVFVGPNNGGKSTILLPLMALQDGLPALTNSDRRLGTNGMTALIELGGSLEAHNNQDCDRVEFLEDAERGLGVTAAKGGGPKQGFGKISGKEPGNFVYPFLSKRKVTSLAETVNEGTVTSVPADFGNLNAKIDRVSNPEFLPAHELYMRACRDILGLRITTAFTSNGKRAVFTVRNMDSIPLAAMGEGTMNVLGLVVHLALAENRLFLIEEPENDIHPLALKALLDLIVEKSEQNQFIITTHSNIVVKRLGAAQEAKVFKVDFALHDRLPTSSVTEVPPDPEQRRER